MNYSVLTNENKSFVSNLNKNCEPNTYLEASLDPNWVKAMNDEMGALYRNHTRDIVDLPKNRKYIGCRWIYEIKYMSNAEIKRYKDILVTKGYNQIEGINYDETFSLVAKIVMVRLMICIVVNHSWSLFQLDVSNAFLCGDLIEDVYMTLPEGYYSKNDSRVCKLVKSLYGLK